MEKLTLDWKNVFRPTPKRVEDALTSMRRVMAGIAATTIAIEAPWWVPFSLVVIQLICEEFAKFIASANDEATEEITVSIPASKSEDVTITRETVQPDN